jgi:hypothetical protein
MKIICAGQAFAIVIKFLRKIILMASTTISGMGLLLLNGDYSGTDVNHSDSAFA